MGGASVSIYRRLLGNSNQFCWITTHYSVAAADRLAWAVMVCVPVVLVGR